MWLRVWVSGVSPNRAGLGRAGYRVEEGQGRVPASCGAGYQTPVAVKNQFISHDTQSGGYAMSVEKGKFTGFPIKALVTAVIVFGAALYFVAASVLRLEEYGHCRELFDKFLRRRPKP